MLLNFHGFISLVANPFNLHLVVGLSEITNKVTTALNWWSFRGRSIDNITWIPHIHDTYTWKINTLVRGRCYGNVILVISNYVNQVCGRSRRSPYLEMSIAPRRRAEILIAVTAGGYCLTRVCSCSGRTIYRGVVKVRWATHQHNPTLLSEASRI